MKVSGSLNILFINSIRMFGGGEVWMLTVLRELKKRGHRVSLVCRPKTELLRKALENGIDVKALRMQSDFDPIAIWRLFRFISDKRINVIFTNMDRELRVGGIAGRLTGVKAIIPRRGIDYPLKDKWRYRFAYNVLASGIIANSKATKRALLREAPWLQSERIRVIYNGIDLSGYSRSTKNVRDELCIPANVPIIGFVGQLDERKGIRYLLEAFSIVHRTIPETYLLMVGKGQLESFIREEARKEGNVVIAGFRDDVNEIMQTVDILALPSLWEGFGIVLIEAMAAGKPVVATDVSSMPEIVQHNKNGFLVPSEDSESLAGALLKLLDDKSLAFQMGRAGRKIIEERFTLSGMIHELEDLFYENVNSG